mmetsp:Transcript_65426/g.211980  ORF Transcript_65426/g.211980 Transcript_65426/m.211980 type:complete len:98 (-) Transcript_65426:184-477(-)
MPLLELFTTPEDADTLARGIVQVNIIVVHDMAPAPFYVSLRAKGTPERTKKAGDLLTALSEWLVAKGHAKGKIRMELYEPSLQHNKAWGVAPLASKL